MGRSRFIATISGLLAGAVGLRGALVVVVVALVALAALGGVTQAAPKWSAAMKRAGSGPSWLAPR